MTTAPLSRRRALAASAAAALGIGAGVAAAASADAALIAQASAFRALQAREHAAWGDLCESDPDEGAEVDACRALSADLREAGEALAEMPAATPAGLGAKAAAVLTLIGPRLDTEYNLGEQQALVASILRDAVRLGGGAHA